MKVLGIDTSTSCGSVGLVEDERVITDYLLNLPVTHSQRLLTAIELVLKEAHCTISDVDGWALSLGPGSFTGLRIGVSAIKGLAFATEKPVAGVSTLDLLASQISPTPYLICPVLDARKGEVYTAFFRYEKNHLPSRQSPYLAIKPEHLIRRIEEPTIFVGDGVRTYGEELKKALPDFALFPPSTLHLLSGSAVAIRGWQLLQRGETLDLPSFSPLYIRPSEAEMKWQDTRHEINRV